jgi:cysteine desulfurase/selenocysteine lyase
LNPTKSSTNIIRDELPIFQSDIFLNWAEASPAPRRSVQSIQQYLSESLTLTGKALHVKWDQIADGARNQIARLLNSEASEVALAGSSTTQGIQIAFNAINPGPGDNIVTCDLEFIMGGVELLKWTKKGVQLKIWKHRNGVYDIDDLAELVDNKTKILFLDSVVWINGYKFDLEEIGKIAHERGAKLVLDVMQHIGAMPLSVKDVEVDFLAAGGHKWLLAPFGVGFLYANKKNVESMEPPEYGYANTDIPGGRGNYFKRIDAKSIAEYPFVKTAKKFEYGGVNSPIALTGFISSLEMINSVGQVEIERRILYLKKILMSELEKIGAILSRPIKEEANFSSITLFHTGRDLEHDYKIVDKLNSYGVSVSGRASNGIGGIRVSLHYPNNEDDIATFIKSLQKAKKETE